MCVKYEGGGGGGGRDQDRAGARFGGTHIVTWTRSSRCVGGGEAAWTRSVMFVCNPGVEPLPSLPRPPNPQVLVFERGPLVFVFNWSPTKDHEGYKVRGGR